MTEIILKCLHINCKKCLTKAVSFIKSQQHLIPHTLYYTREHDDLYWWVRCENWLRQRNISWALGTQCFVWYQVGYLGKSSNLTTAQPQLTKPTCCFLHSWMKYINLSRKDHKRYKESCFAMKAWRDHSLQIQSPLDIFAGDAGETTFSLQNKSNSGNVHLWPNICCNYKH